MTQHDGFDRTLVTWLDEQAGRGAPDYLDEALTRTIRTRQRPAWSSLERWLPMDLTARPRFVAVPPLGKALLFGAVLLAVIGIAIIAAGSRPRVPAPFGPANNGRIAYFADGDIIVADPDGTHAQTLVAGPTDDFAPLFARDGTRFAFWRATAPHETTLMIAASDGSAARPVLPQTLTDADWYEWSPDDRSLAVVHSAIDGSRVLSIVDVDTGAMRTLDVHRVNVDNSVWWRPGTTSELLFSSHAGDGDGSVADIFSIQADGTGLRPIIPSVMGPAEFIDVDLAPDGRTLTYWRWQKSTGSRIHSLDIATGADQELRFDPSSTGETRLLHSPDGTQVLLQREDTAGQIMIAPADASRPGILIGRRFDLEKAPGFGFSPDGKTVFVTYSGEAPQFFDAITGKARGGLPTKADCCSWQRLAP